MKKTLKNVVLCFCAVTISTLWFPQIGNGVSSANALENTELANLETDNSDKNTKSRARKAATKSSQPTQETNATAKSADNQSDTETNEVVESKAASYTATAYALRGRTASGAGVKRGIIAADPRVLPLGTKVRLSAGTWSGTYTVADTGGAVKGRKIDVWVPNNHEARRFGRRKIMLTVINRKKSN